ncbi:hypothetical protein AAVH_41258 [Aphelenchoides avenae]|nr:hypothetical protein AAVH_41258 [Aphelenchus avenae]
MTAFQVLHLFYCTEVLEGIWQTKESGPPCRTVPLDEELDTRVERFRRQLLAGFDTEWKDKLSGAIDSLKLEVAGEGANVAGGVSGELGTLPNSITMGRPSVLSSEGPDDVQPTSKDAVLRGERTDASVVSTEGRSLMLVKLDILPAADHLFGESVFVAPETLRPAAERNPAAEDRRIESGAYATSTGTFAYEDFVELTALAVVALAIQYAYVGVVMLLIALLFH